MQTYLAFFFGFAFLMTSDMITPVNNAVETPALPKGSLCSYVLGFAPFAYYRRTPE